MSAVAAAGYNTAAAVRCGNGEPRGVNGAVADIQSAGVAAASQFNGGVADGQAAVVLYAHAVAVITAGGNAAVVAEIRLAVIK